MSCLKIIICKKESQTKHTSLCPISIHTDGITIELLQGHTLEDRSIIHKQDLDTFDDISKRRLIYFKTLLSKHIHIYKTNSVKSFNQEDSRMYSRLWKGLSKI